MTESNETLLDERGFVFLDEAKRAYKVCMWSGEPWLFYWANNSWVSYRRVTQLDICEFSKRKLSDEDQKLYDNLNNKKG